MLNATYDEIFLLVIINFVAVQIVVLFLHYHICNFL
jgi:hypothetical protein